MNQILDYIQTKLKETTARPFLISIDGHCGSGKTTVANYLQEQLGCSLFHMDDFFLQPHQRTEERLNEPGGNVDYERFQEEVLNHITDQAGLHFRPFSCREWKLGEPVFAPYHDIVLVEGSYSHHPYFKNCYDLKIFLDISPEEQKKRILARDGKAVWPMFEEKWIPMENRYFEAFHIKENSDFVLLSDTSHSSEKALTK